LIARPFDFGGTNRRAAVRAGAGQQVNAMNGISGGRGRNGRGRHRRHRHRVGRRWGVLLPLRPSRPEKPFENDAQADQDENAGPPMSPEKQNRQSDQPEGAAEGPPWIVGSGTITVSSISAHNVVLLQ